LLTIRPNKKSDRSVEVANPNFSCAGVEIKGAFFVDLSRGVRWGKDFDTDFGRARENKGSLAKFDSVAGKPSEVNSLDSVCSGYGALRHGTPGGKELNQESHDLTLAVRVGKTWRGSHEDMSVPIGLDAVRELRQTRISRDFRPTIQVEPCLRFEIRELDHNRHAGKIRQKWKKA
jgi:hypothetical protein